MQNQGQKELKSRYLHRFWVQIKQLCLSIRIYFGVLLFIIFFSLTGCNALFEVFPQDELLEKDFWHTAEDVESSVITCYYDLRRCQDELILYGLGRSDIIDPLTTEIRNIQKGIFTSKYRICDWSRWYKLINDANLVLTKAAVVMETDPGFTEERYRQLMSEARFMRAFAYFYLTRMFKNVPVVTEPSLNDAQDFFPFKSENPGEIFRLIEEDLLYAVQYIPEIHEVTGDQDLTNIATRARATRGAAWALLSDVYLWQNKYRECIEACDMVLSSPIYRILPNENWWDIFNPHRGNSEEAIFELNYDVNFAYAVRDNSSRYGFALDDWFKTQIKGRSTISAMWPLPDIRYYTFTGTGGNRVRKHVGNDATGNGLIPTTVNPNWMIYRMPHVMFNKAEALNREYGSSALEEINQLVRTIEMRAGVIQYENISGGVFEVEEQLLFYKLKETAFEGTRWFDLVRIGLRQWDANMTGTDNILIKSLVDIMPVADQTFVRGNLNNPEAWFTPILEDEILRNPNLTQNPYYQNL